MNASFRLVEDSFEFYPARDFFDHVALCAHNCYQVSAKDHASNVLFVGRLIANGHLAMIEHARFLFRLEEEAWKRLFALQNPYVLLRQDKGRFYASLSLRPILEAKDESRRAFLPLIAALPPEIRSLFGVEVDSPGAVLVPPESEGLERSNLESFVFWTYLLITDRGVSHELVRHRPCSFAQESTRYCNYSKEKFDSCLTFLRPLGYENNKATYDAYFQEVSRTYFRLLSAGLTPQEARSVLPNALKTSIIVTASLSEWDHIFALRCSPHAHPDIRRLMEKVRKDQEERKEALFHGA